MAEKDIGRLLNELNNLIHRNIIKLSQLKFNDNNSPISQSGACIIAYLNDHKDEEVFQRDLEREFSVRRSTMSKVLTVLEQKDLIKRVDVGRDKRLRKIILTDKAKLHVDMIRKERQTLENVLTKGISKEELNNFKATLEKLKQNLLEEVTY